MMRALAAAFALAAALAFAQPAGAWTDQDAQRAAAWGVAYWQQATGRTPPCPPRFTWQDEPQPGVDGDASGAAYLNSCTGFLYRSKLDRAPWATLCQTAIHEVGHMVGYEHTDPEFLRFQQRRPDMECSRAKGGLLVPWACCQARAARRARARLADAPLLRAARRAR